MAKYKVKSDYIALKKATQKTAKGDIFERDIMTINPLEDLFIPGQDVINSDSNFKFSIRTDEDRTRKHTKNNWLLNPDDDEVWTLGDVDSSPVSDETEVRIKPNYTSLKDFAYYGSAMEMVRATINHVIQFFPAELYFTDEIFFGDSSYYLVSNQFEINVDADIVDESKIVNPYRFLCLHAGNYDVYKDGVYKSSGTTKGSFNKSNYTCGNGSLGTVTITNSTKNFTITVYMYEGKKYLLYTDSSYKGYSIRPCDVIINEYFGTIDEFEYVLLNRKSKPLYKAIFETPYETDEGNKYTMESYIWPNINNWNPIIDGITYESYINALINLAEFHDQYDSNVIWRMLTHEAIKNLDWTFFRQNGEDVEDMSKIDSSKIEAFLQLYGRQFDGLKRYIDSIKATNNISYDEKNNLPNYMLTDAVEVGGFDAVLPISTGKTDVMSDPLYSARTEGYSEVDANNYYMKVLKINEHYLNSLKGTRIGIETILRLLGIRENEYQINEYVAVASGISEQCEFSEDLLPFGNNFYPRATGVKYPSVKDVIAINLNKSDLTIDEYDSFFDGIAIRPFRSMSESAITSANPTGEYYYAIPWYENGKHYDGGWYFQAKGGWGKTSKKVIENTIYPTFEVYNRNTLESVGNICYDTREEAELHITDSNIQGVRKCKKVIDGVSFIYDESESYLKFAENVKEMKGFFKSEVFIDMVCYVTDISDIATDENDYSHYFVLLNEDNIGKIDVNGNGWKPITITEIKEGVTEEAKKILYLENIIETTEGNNPHISNGLYDDGMEYLDRMNQIFMEQINLGGDGLVRFSDTDKTQIKNFYIFGINSEYSALTRDNRKCDYYYNPLIVASSAITLCTGSTSGTSVLNEKITQGIISDVYSADSAYTKIYDNVLVKTGTSSDDETEKYYNGKKYAVNPEKSSGGENDEPAANSVINVKNFEIKFIDKPIIEKKNGIFVTTDSLSGCWQTYITDVVMNYVKQMLPSTTIFKWWFTNDLGTNNGIPKPPTKHFRFTSYSNDKGVTAEVKVGADVTSAQVNIDTTYNIDEITLEES